MKLLRATKTLSLKADAMQGNTLRGNASGLGNLDSYSDVIFPSAFGEDVVADFLATGFIADCHDWSKVVAMPTIAEVKGNLVYTECEFHSTDDAQNLKTKCAERIEKGLAVGLSVGIGFYPTSTKTFPNGTALLAYAEAQGEDMSLFEMDAIGAWTGKCRGIIKIDKWYEYSPITTATPANPKAWATDMKNHPGGGQIVSVKGEYLGDYVLSDMTMGAIYRATDALYWRVFYDAIYDYYDEPLADRRAKIEGGLLEYSALVLRVFDAIMQETSGGEDDTESDDSEMAMLKDTPDVAMKSIRSLWNDPDLSTGELPAGSQFATQIGAVLALAKSCNDRARTLLEIRQKDGRNLSPSRREALAANREELSACLKSLSDLLDERGSNGKVSISPAVLSLRLKALRRQNEERLSLLEGTK